MNIREANINDALQISICIYKSWQNAYKDILSKDDLNRIKENSWEESNKKIVASNLIKCYVVEYNFEIVGAVVFGENRMDDSKGEIYALYIIPEFQKQNLGKQLLNVALMELQKKYFKIQLKVMIENKNARNFYEKNNFVNTDEETEGTVQGISIRNIVYNYKK